MPTYKEWITRDLAPAWLAGPWGQKFLGLVGWCFDLATDAARDAVRSRFAETAPADALAHIGRTRNLERYPADTDETYRARLKRPWDIWGKAGSTTRLLDAFHEAGFPNVAVYSIYAGPPGVTPWPPDEDTDNWSRFWIDLQPPYPFPIPDRVRWGEAGRKFDRTWTFGSTLTPAQVEFMRAIVKKWKPAKEICAGIRIRINDAGTLVVLTLGARPAL